jgi:hypothetical protein
MGRAIVVLIDHELAPSSASSAVSLVLFWAASALAAGIAVFVVLGGRPSPVQASMEEIAGLVETLDPLVATLPLQGPQARAVPRSQTHDQHR